MKTSDEMIEARHQTGDFEIFLRKKSGDHDQGGRKREEIFIPEEEKLEEEEPEKTVRCKTCDYDITRPSLAIEPHEHTFRNPAGFSFHILLYSDASGAANTGEPTTEHSWFPDHAWSFAICLNCHSHLGWWFTGKDRFVGLIATRVIR